MWSNTEVSSAWDFLVDNEIVSDDTLRVVVGINGYTMDTINDVCEYLTGMDYEQLIEEAE